MKVMSEHAGLVEAPIDRVRDAVLNPEIFGGAQVTVEVDRAADWVQASGQWWWCGRFQLEEQAGATLIRQRTYNRASGPNAVLIPFTVGRGHRQRGRQSLQHLLDDLAVRLECDVTML